MTFILAVKASVDSYDASQITQYRENDQMSSIFAFSTSHPKLDMTFISAVKASVESYDASQVSQNREFDQMSFIFIQLMRFLKQFLS